MKEKYITPLLEIVTIDKEDIIFASTDKCSAQGGSVGTSAEC